MIEIADLSVGVEREPEPCVFEIEERNPHCVICGRQCCHTMNNWHAGPMIRTYGWFETQEYHTLDAFVWRGVTLLTHNGRSVFDMPIAVISCRRIGDAAYRYSFYGKKVVGVAKRNAKETV